jgi:hypothetical protein
MLFARMKKFHKLLGKRVTKLGLVILVTVASLAGQREIIERSGASLTARTGVVERERVSGVLGGTVTILTLSSCASLNSVSERRAIRCGHQQVA